jgi:hypothetical protein
MSTGVHEQFHYKIVYRFNNRIIKNAIKSLINYQNPNAQYDVYN